MVHLSPASSRGNDIIWLPLLKIGSWLGVGGEAEAEGQPRSWWYRGEMIPAA